MDAYLIVDPDSRNITIPEVESAFGVYGDNNAERKYFKAPRIVGNGIDLTECYLYVNYISASTKIGQILCDVGDAPNGTATEDEIVFSWPITRNVLDKNVSGEIFFAVQAKTKTGDTVFTTRKAKGNCYESIEGTEAVAEEYADIVLQLISRMDNVEANIGEQVAAYFKENPAVTSEYLDQTLQPVKDSVSQLKEDIVEYVFSKTKNVNLLDIDDSDVKHGFYNSMNGEYIANDNALTSGFIPYESDSVYRFTFPTDWFNYSVTLWDEKKSIVLANLSSFISKENGYATFSSTTYSNAKYVRFTIFDTSKDFSTAMVVKDVEYPSTYIPYGYTVKYSKKLAREIENIVKNINPVTIFDNKVILFTGDSICYGANWRPTVEDYSNTGWRKIIQENYPKSITYGYGVGGTTISKRSGRTDSILERMTKMFSEHPEADYIIIEGGVNDAYNITDCPIGTISTGYTAELNENTFAGALESIFKYAQINWIGKKIGYIVTFKVPSAMGQFKFNEYMDIAKQICEKWSVPYCDLYNGSNLNYYIQEVSDAYGGGLHPNEAGYRIITNKIEKWMETL